MLQPSFTVSLLPSLLWLLFLVQSNESAKYCVAPDELSPNSSVCNTLDYYATNGFGGETDNISLYLLSGVHNLSNVMNISHLQSFVMTANDSQDSVTIRLVCESEQCLTMSNISDTATIEFVKVQGTGKVLLTDVQEAIIYNVSFINSGLYIVSDDTQMQTNLNIQHVHFLHGAMTGGQLVACGPGFSDIVIENITVGELEESWSLPRRQVHMFPCEKGVTNSAIYVLLHHNVTLTLSDVTLNHRYGSGMYFHIPRQSQKDKGSNVSVDIQNCFISGYSEGAIVWNSYAHASLTIEGCTLMNNVRNVVQGAVVGRGAQSAALTVYSNNAPLQVTISDSHFQANKDFDYILFFYGGEYAISDCHLQGNVGTAIYAFESRITASGNISFINNTGHHGGALHLTVSSVSLSEHAIMNFYNNRAQNTGGAIFINNPLYILANVPETDVKCFYEVPWNKTGYPASINFANNTAREGGDHIYGTSIRSYCVATETQSRVNSSKDVFDKVFTFSPSLNSSDSLSGISSDPTRVCLCDSSGQPNCTDLSLIFVPNIKVSPGETFSLSAVLAGADFGTSLGAVYAQISDLGAEFGEPGQEVQHINSVKSCIQLQYSLKSNRTNVVLYLLPSDSKVERYETEQKMNYSIQDYYRNGVPPIDLQTALITVNITLVPCPPGFTLKGDPPRCDCYNALIELGVNCTIKNGTGFVTHTDMIWISVFSEDGNETDSRVIYNQNCPLEFCTNSRLDVDLENDPDVQCAFNHAGRLCGGCKEGYSLAIGSSHCIHCPNNNNLALLIFFAAAGFLLVFFITALNLTFSIGLLNGIIFYANIVWTYKSLLFPDDSNSGIIFLKTFIAWLNLDFGIETCFFQGMDAFWKTWLQFLFPFYIWIISGAIIVCCRYSSRMTNIFGNRAVPVLATLLCLSYVKLMQTIINGLAFSVLKTSPDNSTVIVWSLDGNLRYGQFPHIFLLLAVLVALLLLWAPYTIALIFTQWFRKLSFLRICKCTVVYKPFYDCQFACLKDKHHYWHGTLLLVRGIHLVIYALTSTSAPAVNLFLLHLSAMLLLLYEVYMQLYRSKSVQLLHGSILLNLAVLGGSVVYAELVEGQKTVAIVLSVSVVFVQFWVLIFFNLATAVYPLHSKIWYRYRRRYDNFEDDSESNSEVQERSVNNGNYFSKFRDSILDNTLSFENPVQ